jgi:hypothetical protein
MGAQTRCFFSSQRESTVSASNPQRFEYGFAAVFANKDFSDKLVVRTISRFMNR